MIPPASLQTSPTHRISFLLLDIRIKPLYGLDCGWARITQWLIPDLRWKWIHLQGPHFSIALKFLLLDRRIVCLFLLALPFLFVLISLLSSKAALGSHLDRKNWGETLREVCSWHFSLRSSVSSWLPGSLWLGR